MIVPVSYPFTSIQALTASSVPSGEKSSSFSSNDFNSSSKAADSSFHLFLITSLSYDSGGLKKKSVCSHISFTKLTLSLTSTDKRLKSHNIKMITLCSQELSEFKGKLIICSFLKILVIKPFCFFRIKTGS